MVICTVLSVFSLFSRAMAANKERTFIMVKPDGVQRNLVGEIIKRFEIKGFKLVAMKFVLPSEDLLKKHYAEHIGRPFFPGLVKYMSSGPVVAMVWEGLNVVKTGRFMMGATNPADSAPGTIRGDFCIQVGRRCPHRLRRYETSSEHTSRPIDRATSDDPVVVLEDELPNKDSGVGDELPNKDSGVGDELPNKDSAVGNDCPPRTVAYGLLTTVSSYCGPASNEPVHSPHCINGNLGVGGGPALRSHTTLRITQTRKSRRNIVHGSDSVESAQKEISLWFDSKELVAWQPATQAWIYED